MMIGLAMKATGKSLLASSYALAWHIRPALGDLSSPRQGRKWVKPHMAWPGLATQKDLVTNLASITNKRFS